MNKKKPKSKRSTKDAFTPTEVGTLIEQLRSEFKVFGERQEGISNKLDATFDQVGRNAEDIALLKAAVKNMAAKIEALTKSIDKLVQTKADREEIQALNKRVDALEAKVASLSR